MLPYQSPRDPSSQMQSVPNISAELTDIKIRLRQESAKRKTSTTTTDKEHSKVSNQRRKLVDDAKIQDTLGQPQNRDKGASHLGKDDVTVRFVWETE